MNASDITKLRQQRSTADFISTSPPTVKPAEDTEDTASEERTETPETATPEAAPEAQTAAKVEELVMNAASLSFKKKEIKKDRRVTLFFIPAEYERAKAAAISTGAASFNEWATAVINAAAEEIIKGGGK